MECLKLEIEEGMTEKELDEVAHNLETAARMLQGQFDLQDKWEKDGIDLRQIGSSAKSDIDIIGEKAWLGIRREKLDGFRKEQEEAVKKVKDAKAKLKKEQA